MNEDWEEEKRTDDWMGRRGRDGEGGKDEERNRRMEERKGIEEEEKRRKRVSI